MFRANSDNSWFLRIGILGFVLALGLIRLAISCCRDDEERVERRNRRARLRREAKERAAKERRDFVQKHLESYTYEGPITENADPEGGSERENDDEENQKGNTKSELECAICLSSVRVGNVMAKPTGPTCKHRSFHYQCLSEYLSKSPKQTQCPICRGTFMKEDISRKTSPQSRDEDEGDAEQDDNEGRRMEDV